MASSQSTFPQAHSLFYSASAQAIHLSRYGQTHHPVESTISTLLLRTSSKLTTQEILLKYSVEVVN